MIDRKFIVTYDTADGTRTGTISYDSMIALVRGEGGHFITIGGVMIPHSRIFSIMEVPEA